MSLFKQFSKSLYSFKHIAAFRFQGIGKTISYLFFLSFIMSLPGLWVTVLYMTTDTHSAKQMMEELLPFLTLNQGHSLNNTIFIIAALIFYYVLLSFTLFLKAMIFASFSLIFVVLLKKRGEYRHLFRMTAYSFTLPSLLTTLAELSGVAFSFAYLVDWLLISLILLLSIRYLPGAPK